jgi:hypothetical protein
MALAVLLAGCGGDDEPADDDAGTALSADASSGRRTCIDNDDDGFGDYCSRRDCDDDDPDITDECYRCSDNVPMPDCPCDPGTKPSECDPPDARIMLDNGNWATVYCTEGTMYCRDEVWTDCEILWEYATIVEDS